MVVDPEEERASIKLYHVPNINDRLRIYSYLILTTVL